MTGTAMGPGREFDLIRRMLAVWGDSASGIGNDVALITPIPTASIVASVDSSTEGVHFRRGWLTPREIGYRASVAALSDLAAAGAHPLGMLIALTLPGSWTGDLEDLALGIRDAAQQTGAKILGGDTDRGELLSLSFTVLGSAARPLARGGAQPGDSICVTGDVGRSAAALAKLLAGGTVAAAERERFAHPVPRIDEGILLAQAGATAAIDISDGLGSELRHLAAASDVRLSVHLDRIPVSAGIDPLRALSSGEEYELLVTLPRGVQPGSVLSGLQTPLTRIGEVVAGPGDVQLLSDGVSIDLPGGHDHF